MEQLEIFRRVLMMMAVTLFLRAIFLRVPVYSMAVAQLFRSNLITPTETPITYNINGKRER
jgi:hypothetical protein